MATPIEFDEADDVADFPPPRESRPLPIKVVGQASVSCWVLSPEELEEVNKTGKVWVRTSQVRKASFAPVGPIPENEACQPAMSVNGFKDRILS
jgi:hypothetical protein